MPREKEDFREIYSMLLDKFNGAEVITLNQAAEYTSTDKRTLLADKTFPKKQICSKYIVHIVSLARWLA